MALVLILVVLMSLLSFGTSAPTKTSLKDQNPNVLDILQKANSKRGDLTDGDIMIKKSTENLPDDVQMNALCTLPQCIWPKDADGTVRVPYAFENGFSKRQKNFIQSVLDGFQAVTCITFTETRIKKGKNAPNLDYVSIIPGSGCWSYVGRTGGKQQLSLQTNVCLYKQIVQHEMIHALGFMHEHSRSDRDLNVIINYENIQEGRETNFDKYNTNNLQTPYDFDSVMQYHNTAFSSNGQWTIVDKNDADHRFGNAIDMSPNDILRINTLYGCNNYL